MKVYSAYISKHNSNYEKQVILLIILNEEKQEHYLAVKNLLALLRGITSRNTGDFCCLNYLHSFRTKTKLESHERTCEKKKNFCNVNIPSGDTKILEFYK